MPVIGLVDAAALKPGDLIGVNKDNYLVLDTLPPEYVFSFNANIFFACVCLLFVFCCICFTIHFFSLFIFLGRYDARVKAMEVDDPAKLTEGYDDVGGLDKQIQELVEAVVLPITHRDRFEAVGIQPPKGTNSLFPSPRLSSLDY